MDLRILIRAAMLDKAGAERERWTRPQLLEWQQPRFDAVVRHAAERSPFYRAVEHPPVIDKRTLMEHYDEIVTDPALRRDALLAHVDGLDGDTKYAGRFRVIATSGSSGLKGLFVYDDAGWAACCAGFLRQSRWNGTGPRLPRRRKIAFVGPPGGAHMSRRMASTLADGPFKLRVIPVTMPIPRLVDELNAFQADLLAGFPTVIGLLAREPGLRIAPTHVSTSSELCTPQIRAAIAAAWNVRPIDIYGITEAGILGATCAHGHMHVFEDLMRVEVADEHGDPVPEGETGRQMLVTSLDNLVQPTIRMAVPDVVALDTSPCPCGVPFARLRVLEGRADDVLHLGGIVVHPLQFTAVAQAQEVREFQIVERPPGIVIRVALRRRADEAAVRERLRRVVAQRLAALGVPDPEVDVEVCEALERDPARMGKLKLVVAAGRDDAARCAPSSSPS
jgi:phenylacetate-CoA ligase